MMKDVFAAVMVISNVVNLIFFLRQSFDLGYGMFSRLWSIVDGLSLALNIFLILSVYFFNFSVEWMRWLETMLCLCMWFKALYYLGLVEEISPLIDIIFVIVKDIRYFIVVYIIALTAFIMSFWIMGKNQQDLVSR
jgi:hypothetical protein